MAPTFAVPLSCDLLSVRSVVLFYIVSTPLNRFQESPPDENMPSLLRKVFALKQKERPFPKRVSPVAQIYFYTELTAASDIRLLYLSAGAAGQPLTGRLIATQRSKLPKYKALSYTWGNATPVASLQLPEGVLGIAGNLELALRRLRSTTEVQVLWVDAICINQGDPVERSYQVSLMKQIYGDSEECIVYLGEQQDGSQLLPAFFDRYFEAIGKMLRNREIMPGDNIIKSLHHMYASLPDDDDPAWNAFVLLLHRPWFRRIWIIQEYALPRKVTMVCGHWAIDGTILSAVANLNRNVFVQLLVDGNFSGRKTTEGFQEIAREVLDLLCWFIELRQHNNRTEGFFSESDALRPHLAVREPSRVDLNFLTLRSHSSNCLATDPRDMYFALLGLSNDLDNTGLRADYTKSLDQVAAQFGSYFVQSGQGMQLLRQVHLRDPILSPSWSGVERAVHGSSSILNLIEEKARDHPYAHDLLPRGIVEVTHNPNILSVRGALLDTVKHLGTVMDQSAIDEQSHEPPKWLSKLAISTNALVLRDLNVNVPPGSPRQDGKPRTNPHSALLDKYNDFTSFVFGQLDTALYSASQPAPKKTDTHRHSAQFWTSSKRFEHVKMCVTERGFFGLVPPSAKQGDHIFMIERDMLKSMFIVRKHPVHGIYLWNGLVYVHNMAPMVNNTYATDRICVG